MGIWEKAVKRGEGTEESEKGKVDGWDEGVREIARGIRRRVLEYALRSNGGYVSQACSSAELLASLYGGLMRLGPSEGPQVPLPFPGSPSGDNPGYFTGASYNGPHGAELDRFYFSPVHYALVLYAALIEVGRLAPEGLEMFNRDGSSVELIGAEHSPGHEVTAGSLGQCLSQAAGIAMGRRLNGETGRNWVFMSDGEFQEGQTWEAVAALVWHKLDKVIVVADFNGQQCDGEMETVMGLGPMVDKLTAFGAMAIEVDGHDPVSIAAASALAGGGKPLFIIARTDPCRGLELLRSRAPKLHFVRFKTDEERKAYEEALCNL